MTALEKEIQKLPKLEKLGFMEFIWADLLKGEDPIQAPDWHHLELEATEKNIQEGKEHFEDWNAAKEAIRRA
ncbi:addiction module protein [bacterium]|nr:addiction module protein [Verrucomicrobiota bacterium]MDA7682508.1 addiction module protein [bacterium]MDB4690079.1 addiction module protein [Verrucomicrobiota bacterium]